MRPITRSEFARLAGVSPAAITKACGRQLAPAKRGDRLDLDHPAAAAYLASKGRAASEPARAPTEPLKKASRRAPAPMGSKKRPAKRRSKPTAARLEPAPAQPRGTSEELEGYARILRPLLDRFGTDRGFRDWLLSLKELETIRSKMLENEETEGRLISRELVKTHILGAVEACNRRLLTDFVKTATRRLYAAKAADVPVEEAERMIRDAVTAQLKPMANTVARLLRGQGADASV